MTIPAGPEPDPTRASLRPGAALVIAGEILYAVATPLWHPGGNPDPVGELADYAGSRSWALVHVLQFGAAVLVGFGLLALAHGVTGPGHRTLVSRCAGAAAIVAIAVNAVLYAVDGVALEEAVNAWTGASPSAQPMLLAVVEGVRGVEWGLRAHVDYATGLTLVLLAVAMVTGAGPSRALGYLAGLLGLLSVLHGIGYAAAGTALSDHALLGTTTYVLGLLVLLWAVGLAVVVGRASSGPSRAGADAGQRQG